MKHMLYFYIKFNGLFPLFEESCNINYYSGLQDSDALESSQQTMACRLFSQGLGDNRFYILKGLLKKKKSM